MACAEGFAVGADVGFIARPARAGALIDADAVHADFAQLRSAVDLSGRMCEWRQGSDGVRDVAGRVITTLLIVVGTHGEADTGLHIREGT